MSSQVETFTEQAKERELDARLAGLDRLSHDIQILLTQSERSKDIRRVIDLMNKLSIQLQNVSLLVLDNANRDLEAACQAFSGRIAEIRKSLPQSEQGSSR